MRNALALAAAALVLAAGPGWALDVPKLTCDAFKHALDDAIHAQGDKVATPKDWHISNKDLDLKRTLSGFSGIVGIKGDLNCFMTDEFRQFTFKADTEAKTDEQGAIVLTRSIALASASICAGGLRTGDECWVTALDMTTKAVHTMKAAYDRGEPLPHGNEEIEVEDVGEARLTAMAGEMLFEVISYR